MIKTPMTYSDTFFRRKTQMPKFEKNISQQTHRISRNKLPGTNDEKVQCSNNIGMPPGREKLTVAMSDDARNLESLS